MLKTNILPITTGIYRIVAPPRAAQQDRFTPISSLKCARRGCGQPHLKNELWCREHLHCGPETSCDDIPAISD